MVDFGDGELYMHSEMLTEEFHKPSVMQELERIFLLLCLGLQEEGMDVVKTFVDPAAPDQGRFCEFFGFDYNGVSKTFINSDGKEFLRHEMTYSLPLDNEGVRE